MQDSNEKYNCFSDLDSKSYGSCVNDFIDLDSSKKISTWVYYAAASVPLTVALMPFVAKAYLALDDIWKFPFVFRILFASLATQIFLVLGILGAFFLFATNYSSWREDFCLKNWNWSALFIGPCLTFIAYLPLTLLSVISYFFIEYLKKILPKELINLFDFKYQVQEYLLQLDWGYFVIFVFAAVIIAPIVEETAFRNIFYKALNSKLSTTSSIFLTSFVFAMVHMNIIVFPSIFVLGILLQLLFNYKKNIFYSIFMHASYNAVSLTFLAAVKYFKANGVL